MFITTLTCKSSTSGQAAPCQLICAGYCDGANSLAESVITALGRWHRVNSSRLFMGAGVLSILSASATCLLVASPPYTSVTFMLYVGGSGLSACLSMVWLCSTEFLFFLVSWSLCAGNDGLVGPESY